MASPPPRQVSSTEAEFRRINDLVNQVYNEVLGNISVIHRLPAGGRYEAMARELEAKMLDLRAAYASDLSIRPTRERVLSDLLQVVEDKDLRSTVEMTLHPPAPEWVQRLDGLEAKILEMAGIPASAGDLLAPQLGQAVDAVKSAYWFRPNPPTDQEILTALRERVSDIRLINIIDALMQPYVARPSPAPAAVPARVEAPPTEAAPATRAARRYAAPTIAELQRDGFGNLIDMGLGGTIYRFAAKDSGLDVIGMSVQQLMDYAAANPGQMRIFVVNRRGFATRELHAESERDMARIRASMEAEQA